MPLKKFDHGNWKWLALLIFAPAAMMLVTSGRRKPHSKGDLTKDDGRSESTSTPSAPTTTATPTTRPSTTIWTTSMAPAASTATASPSLGVTATAIDLSSPTATVESQMMLLREGRDEEFRKTFLPSVTISAEEIEACKKKVASSVVKPDWEVAEDQVVDGHRVKRVSMFGKSMTGFHDTGGKWLADHAWCVPVGVP